MKKFILFKFLRKIDNIKTVEVKNNDKKIRSVIDIYILKWSINWQLETTNVIKAAILVF